MKNILCFLFAAFLANGAFAQNMKQQKDSLLRPTVTDSADFKDNPSQEKNRDSKGSDYDRTKFRKDSLPADDRKPKSEYGSRTDSIPH